VKSRQCNETLLVRAAVRPGKKLGLQSAAKNDDIEAKKLTVQQAMVLVWDRNKWKHQVAASASLK